MSKRIAVWIVAVVVLLAGAVAGWQGVQAWRKRPSPASVGPATPSQPAPPWVADGFVWNDAEVIDPARDLPSAAAAFEEVVESAVVSETPAPIDVWRPRMQELAKRALTRMQAIWTGDVEALESLTREEGGQAFVDPEIALPETMREFGRDSKQWAQAWNLAPVARQARVRRSTFAQGFSPPIPPPRRIVRNPMNPIYSGSAEWNEELQPDTVIHEVLIPAKPRSPDGTRVDDVVWLGFAYYWSEVNQRWHAIGTSVYAPNHVRSEAEAAQAPVIVAPP